MEMTAYSDAAAFTAEIAADPSAVGFLNSELRFHFSDYPRSVSIIALPHLQSDATLRRIALSARLSPREFYYVIR
jgi:hypothetical protein